MIRRNTANQVIYLPCLKLTADGAAVTSAATLTVAKDGTESASAGTLAHSAGGVWKYTPTQDETDAAIVALILTATGADPVVLNCVTTGADTSAVALGANTTAPATPTNVSDAQAAIIVQIDANETKIDAIKTKTDNLPIDPADQSLVIDATTTILGRLPAALEGGRMAAVLDTATQTQLDDIEIAINAIGPDQLAAITVESGVIGNFPETLTIGDSYTENTGQIRINITDTNGDPITEFGSLQLSEADISFTAFRPNDSAVLSGTCEFVDDITETYVLLTLPSSETSLGKAEYTYEGRLKFFWEGPSSGESDDEQKTYKTTPFKFIANP